MAKLDVGEPAPEFSLEDQDGNRVSLSDFRGRKLIVYFYPRADTPGCTKQSCSVRDARDDLAGLGVDAVGISPDKPAKQKKFDDKYELGFPLLSDPDRSVAEAWGAYGEKKLHGNVTMGIIRSSFLVDEKGRIAQASYKVKPLDTVPDARVALS